jgi:hypothetical protein
MKDPYVGVGPRGFHPHYIECLRSSSSTTAQQAYEMFRTIGTTFLSGKMHNSIRALILTGMVTPLNKTDPSTTDTLKIRPIKCEDADCNLWSKAASKANTRFVLAEVAPQQLGIGVSVANETLVHGERMCYEKAYNDDQSLATHYVDIEKAHNDFERANTLIEIYRLAEVNPHLRSIAIILHSVLSVEPKIFIRDKNGSPDYLCDSKRGGGQGNALTGIAFCLNINPVLKQMTQEYPNIHVLAYHDDIKLLGPPSTLYEGIAPAVTRLNQLLQENKNEVNEDKGMAFALKDEDRRLIFDNVKQPKVSIDDCDYYGYITNGIPMGSPEFIAENMRKEAISFRTSSLSIIKRIASMDKMAARTAIHFSLQTKCDYFQRCMPPHQLKYYLDTVTETLRACYHEALELDLLSTNEEYRDPNFTPDRFTLRSSLGGGGYRPPHQRYNYLSCLNVVLPQLIQLEVSKPEEAHTVTLFPTLTDVLGRQLFEPQNIETRFQTFLESDISTARNFRESYNELITRRDQYFSTFPELVPEDHQILEPLLKNCASIGYGIKNLGKAFSEAFSFLHHRDLIRRAQLLDISDPRRISFLACQENQFANSLFTSWPPCDIAFTSTEFIEAVARIFGAPSPALKHSIGKPIKGSRGSLTVDAHGYNILTASGVVGDHFRSLHDFVVQILVAYLHEVGIPHSGGYRNTCKNLFSHVINIDEHDDIDKRNLQGIIPDILIKLEHLNRSPDSIFQGRQTLVDIKILSPGIRYRQQPFTNQEVVNKRADEVNREYYAKAKALDRKYNGTADEAIGPVQGTLLTYGHQGKVVGFVFGTFAECSDDVSKLIKLIIDAETQRQAIGTTIDPSNFKSNTTRRFTTKLGHAIHRGWSRILLERLDLLVNGIASNTQSSESLESQEQDFHEFHFSQ